MNVVINFQFLFFGVRIDQLITLQRIKVPKGEDPSVEVPRRGEEGKGKRLKRGRRVLVFVVLVHAALIFRAYLAWTNNVFFFCEQNEMNQGHEVTSLVLNRVMV